jgi:hypothetical protein
MVAPKGLVGTDGSRLYLGVEGGFNNSSIGIMQMPASGGEPERLPMASNAILPLDLSQDEAKLLAQDVPRTGHSGQLLSFPILGGTPRRLGEL